MAQVLHHIIKPGGYLLNAGPLLYHWAQADDDAAASNVAEVSIELSLGDVRAAACGLGFTVLEESEAQMQYLADRHGLYQTTYTGVRWVMRKDAAPAPEGKAPEGDTDRAAAAAEKDDKAAAAGEGDVTPEAAVTEMEADGEKAGS